MQRICSEPEQIRAKNPCRSLSAMGFCLLGHVRTSSAAGAAGCSEQLLCRFKLAVVQVGIQSASRQQLLVISCLNNVALVQNEDHIRIFYR